jgi:hypothetical protein
MLPSSPVPMERVLSSTWFLASTAACCGLSAAFTTWLAQDSSSGVRLLAALIGLAAGLAVMLLFAWAAADETDASAPVASTPVSTPPEPVRTVEQPQPGDAHGVLALRLEEGRALSEELEPGAADPRVGSWIEGVRQSIEQRRPGLAGYFNQLAQRAYADDRVRLDAHLRRLETIVRDAM